MIFKPKHVVPNYYAQEVIRGEFRIAQYIMVNDCLWSLMSPEDKLQAMVDLSLKHGMRLPNMGDRK